MDPTAALIAGLAAGIAIAVQFGAVSLLLVETAVAGGPRAGIAAGMGVATVDLLFAAAAAVAGATAGALLAAHETELRLVAAVTLASIAVHGLIGLRRRRRRDERGGATRRATRRPLPRFFAITLAQPADDRLVRRGGRLPPTRRSDGGDRVRGGRRRCLRRLAPRAHRRGRPRGPVDHAARAARACHRRPRGRAADRRAPRYFSVMTCVESVSLVLVLTMLPLAPS